MSYSFDDLVQYYAELGPVVLLESQSDNHPASKTTYLAAMPEATIKARGRRVEITRGDQSSTCTANPWQALNTVRQRWGDWMFGYIGYDMKNHNEGLHSRNPDEIGAPDLFFMKPGLLLRRDEKTQTVTVLKGNLPDEISTHPQEKPVSLKNMHATVLRKSYRAAIKVIQEKICEGVFYEMNLTQMLKAEFQGSAFHAYRQMRQAGPVPFGAYISCEDFSVASMSPERFLSKKGEKVFSQPMKGTMKRDAQHHKDRELTQKLKYSEKNRAENMMVVDMVRNDLSRIARPGSVEVPKLFEIQTFPTVHQMVSTVCAETTVENPISILKACFPMGSMTGAPKVSAMQTIEALEHYRRGIYSGAVGYIEPGGDFDFNVVIRTAIMKDDRLYYPVGGAITADSDPDDEWEEMWLKAETLRSVVE